MAVVQIPNLPTAIALTGAEQLEIVQAGSSCRTTTGAIADLNDPAITALQADVLTLRQVPCASFYSTATQTHGGIGTTGILTLNQTDFANDISLQSSSRITVGVSGIFNLEFSLQLVSPDNNKHACVWLKKNGSDVAWSNTEVDLPNKDYGYVAAWNFMVDMSAGQYLELAWTSDDNVAVKAVASPPYGPAIPSAIVTMGLIRRA